MLDKKCFLTIVFCVCLIAIISGVSFSAEAIKIGVAGPLSGGLAPYGIPTARAAELVLNKINSHFKYLFNFFRYYYIFFQ